MRFLKQHLTSSWGPYTVNTFSFSTLGGKENLKGKNPPPPTSPRGEGKDVEENLSSQLWQTLSQESFWEVGKSLLIFLEPSSVPSVSSYTIE